MEIMVKVDLVSKALNDLDIEIERFRESISNFKKISLSDIHQYWQGSDYENTFEHKMISFCDDLNCYLESLESYQKFLQNYLNGLRAIHQYYEKKPILITGR
jgi:hypothetical protein